ncbi:MAG: FAD binding domain-containing protein [Acidimicrobiales bacterium]
MTFLQPRSLADALSARAQHEEAVALQGGTDVYVEVNFGRLRPTSLLDLGRVDELRGIARHNGTVRIGAGTTYHEMIEALKDDAPALVIASRTVGSPPIRNRGTIGGNLGSASPAGDCHPPLLAVGATVELASSKATRLVPVEEFFVAPKRSVLQPDEVIVAVHMARATGPQNFSKVGVRNAMVIAVCSFAIALHPESGRVGTGIGSAGPVPLRAREAEGFLEGHLAAGGRWETRAPLEESVVGRFGELVAAGAQPIDDVRGSAAYRRHALAVLARRSLTWCWDEYAGRPR